MTVNFLVEIDPGFLEGATKKDRLCELCGLRRAQHDHHAEFKKMGGRKGKAKAYIERPENHKYICSVCHSAIHIEHQIDSDGFCCEKCPKQYLCFYGARILKRPYRHLIPPF